MSDRQIQNVRVDRGQRHNGEASYDRPRSATTAGRHAFQPSPYLRSMQKRVFDIVGAALLLVFLAPLMVVVALAIAPWGEVYVDGDRKGVTPPVNEIEVAPGKRKIEIRNANFPVYVEVVDLKADQKVRIKHRFSQE